MSNRLQAECILSLAQGTTPGDMTDGKRFEIRYLDRKNRQWLPTRPTCPAVLPPQMPDSEIENPLREHGEPIPEPQTIFALIEVQPL